jgi:hypothetical protein
MNTVASSETSSPWSHFHTRKAFRCVLSSRGMKDHALLVPLALTDQKRRLAVSQEVVSDSEGSNLRVAKAGGKQGVEESPGADSSDGAALLRFEGPRLGLSAQASQFLGGEVADLTLSGGRSDISLIHTWTPRAALTQFWRRVLKRRELSRGFECLLDKESSAFWLGRRTVRQGRCVSSVSRPSGGEGDQGYKRGEETCVK